MIAGGSVDIGPVVSWLATIPWRDWPQQHRLRDGGIRPAMVTDLAWHGFGERTQLIVDAVLCRLPIGSVAYQRMLSVVMPGHSIERHTDSQAPYWLCRVHVPLISNNNAWFEENGVRQHMVPGNVYFIDTTKEHAISNEGESPRVHIMFDVRR